MADDGLSRAAFEALYLELEKPVFNVVYRWVWNVDEAREVTQEAFMKLWSARARVRMETVKPLVFQSALNLASNRLRMRKLRRFFSLEAAVDAVDPRASTDAALERAQTQAQVRAAVEALPKKLKAVVMLCELSGLSTKEISETLGIPQGTVGSRRHQAMAVLEASLGSEVRT
jgi:RNA polymerase sigma-70 factor (ECF subfamily)